MSVALDVAVGAAAGALVWLGASRTGNRAGSVTRRHSRGRRGRCSHGLALCSRCPNRRARGRALFAPDRGTP